MPYPQTAAKGNTGPQQRRSYGQTMLDDGSQDTGYEPETPDPQEQRATSRASAPGSSASQVCPSEPPVHDYHCCVSRAASSSW